MSGRRIRLDLSDFVLDAGSHRWMFLSDAKFSTVSDLVEQLKDEYIQLVEEDIVQVFMDGEFVIPLWESIEILQSGDLVRIVKTKSVGRKKSKIQLNESASAKKKVIGSECKTSRDIKNKKKGKVDAAKDSTSSSSSDSDTAEDITSKITVAPVKKTSPVKKPTPVKKTVRVNKPVPVNQPALVKVLSSTSPIKQDKNVTSSSSDSSDSSSDDNEVSLVKKPKVNENPIIKKSVSKTYVVNPSPSKVVPQKSIQSNSSSSDSSSDESNHEKSFPDVVTKTIVVKNAVSSTGLIEAHQKTVDTKEDNVSDKPLRKRKRKNKNKNKLLPDQVPSFGPEIIPTEAAIRHIDNTKTKNDHVRFGADLDQSDSMDVDKAEVFTEEEIRQLYSQSVSSPQVRNGTGKNSNSRMNVPTIAPSNFESKAKNGESKNNFQESTSVRPIAPMRKTVKASVLTSVVSCEDALMKQFDDKIVSNDAVVNKTAPKIVFTPRVLNLKEMKKESPKTSNFQLSNQSVADMSQFSALLNCKGEVFNKKTGQVDVYSNKSAVLENKDYSAYHAVSASGPRVGDVIAFKLVEMGENYAPEVSDYKEGKVLECDGTNTVTFELLIVSKKKMAGKFDIEDDLDQEEKVKTLNWAELIEARLMFP